MVANTAAGSALYLCGWVLALPLVVIGLPGHQHSLVGTLISVLLLLILLPQWCRLRWNSSSFCWRSSASEVGAMTGAVEWPPPCCEGC